MHPIDHNILNLSTC